jgi:hypothetical protein
MRNPMDSWAKSDSIVKYAEIKKGQFIEAIPIDLEIGQVDLQLAQSLIMGGSEHRKFLRQIAVSVDILAPRFWWSEFDTYHIGVVTNSCSTMHKLKSYPITKEMFEIDENQTEDTYWNLVINHLEGLRQKYIETKDYKWFRLLKESLPEGFLQKRTVLLNYENVFSMIHQRKNHRLKEWFGIFIDWAKDLPHADELLFFKRKLDKKQITFELDIKDMEIGKCDKCPFLMRNAEAFLYNPKKGKCLLSGKIIEDCTILHNTVFNPCPIKNIEG